MAPSASPSAPATAGSRGRHLGLFACTGSVLGRPGSTGGSVRVRARARVHAGRAACTRARAAASCTRAACTGRQARAAAGARHSDTQPRGGSRWSRRCLLAPMLWWGEGSASARTATRRWRTGRTADDAPKNDPEFQNSPRFVALRWLGRGAMPSVAAGARLC